MSLRFSLQAPPKVVSATLKSLAAYQRAACVQLAEQTPPGTTMTSRMQHFCKTSVRSARAEQTALSGYRSCSSSVFPCSSLSPSSSKAALIHMQAASQLCDIYCPRRTRSAITNELLELLNSFKHYYFCTFFYECDVT